MEFSPYTLDENRRECVLQAIREVCAHRDWTLLSAHVRMTHVHAIVVAEVQPEEILNDFKRYASRKLNQRDSDDRTRNRWSRHGSTLWLWKDEDVRHAIEYVVNGQGTPMAVFATDGAI